MVRPANLLLKVFEVPETFHLMPQCFLYQRTLLQEVVDSLQQRVALYEKIILRHVKNRVELLLRDSQTLASGNEVGLEGGLYSCGW